MFRNVVAQMSLKIVDRMPFLCLYQGLTEDQLLLVKAQCHSKRVHHVHVAQ